MASMLMGMWFLAMFAGNYLSGVLGMFWEKLPKETFFLMLSLIAFVAGCGMVAMLKPIKRGVGRGLGEKADV
jgi:POT family proton-dependent oligopeptide transporter